MTARPPTPYVLCDTSVASQLIVGAPTGHWPEDTLARLARSVKTVSVVTVAEIRAGQIKAGWGERRRADAAHALAGYLWAPLDPAIVDEWARLSALAKRGGIGIGDNDVWIAATALRHGWPLATSDADHVHLAGLEGSGLELIWVPRLA